MEFASSFMEVLQSFLEFFSRTLLTLVSDWWALPIEKRIGSLLGFVVAAGTGLHSLQWLGQRIFRTRARLEEQIDGLRAEVEQHEKTIANMRVDLAARDARIAELLEWLPATPRKAANRERHDGNEETEARILSGFVNKLAPDLAGFSRELAEFHAARSFENPKYHLDEARRFIHLADLMEPNSNKSDDLASEVERLYSEFQVARLQEQGNGRPADFIARELGLETMWLPETRIDYLRDLGFALEGKGYDQAAFLFVDRAARYAVARYPQFNSLRATTECWAGVFEADAGRPHSGWARFERAWPFVKSSLGEQSKPALQLRCHRARLRSLLGHYEEALKEADALLHIYHGIGGEQFGDILEVRELRASFLDYLGRYDEALREVDVLLSSKGEVGVKQHPSILVVRRRRASILHSLGRCKESLDEIDGLLPDLSEREPVTLLMRGLRASVLRDLGRNEEALNEFDALLPLRYEISGEHHPFTLAVRHERAFLLMNLHRNQEALDEFNVLLPIQARVFGEGHPDTLTTRHVRASVLAHLGHIDDALREIEALLLVQRETRGEHHPYTLASASLRLGILVVGGRAREALDCLPSVLRELEAAVGADHRFTLTTRYRMARARLVLGHSKIARAECVAILSALPAIMAPTHPLFLSTIALSEGNDGKLGLLV